MMWVESEHLLKALPTPHWQLCMASLKISPRPLAAAPPKSLHLHFSRLPPRWQVQLSAAWTRREDGKRRVFTTASPAAGEGAEDATYPGKGLDGRLEALLLVQDAASLNLSEVRHDGGLRLGWFVVRL